MKKFKLAFLSILSFFICTLITNAASKCDYSELAEINKEASAVKLSYEEKQRILEGDNGVTDSEEQSDEPFYESYFVVNITNVTDNLYIKVTNSADDSTKIFTSNDAVDGIISFEWNELDTVANLTAKVFTSNKTSCPDEEIVVQYKTLPMFNYYSDTAYCYDHKKEDICQQYVTSEVTEEQFNRKYEESQKEKTEEVNNTGVAKKVTNFVKKNKKGFIIGGSIIIVIGVVTTVVVIIKRRRSRLI